MPYEDLEVWQVGANGLYRRGRPPVEQRPTGPGYTRYEDLYQSGDTVTEALNRMTEPAIVTFPEGEWLLSDFRARDKGGVYTGGAINLQRDLVRGVIGSGRGTLGGTSGTIFRMLPDTSTLAGTPALPTQQQGGVSQAWIMRSVDAGSDLTFRNFQLVGAAQRDPVHWPRGHNFGGLYVFRPGGNVTVDNVLVAGQQGDSGAPPGETFGIIVYQNGPGKTIIRNCEVDGRREIGGEWFSSSGITSGRSLNAEIRDCWVHHRRVGSGIVNYRAFDTLVENCVMDTTDTKQITGSFHRTAFNNEHGDGVEINNCTFLKDEPGGVNVTWSNTFLSVMESGWPAPRSCANGQCIIRNPTWTPLQGNPRFYIQSWQNGIDGRADDSMTSAPTVLKADGTPLQYTWVHDKHYIIN